VLELELDDELEEDVVVVLGELLEELVVEELEEDVVVVQLVLEELV